jgi:hypothetical protein
MEGTRMPGNVIKQTVPGEPSLKPGLPPVVKSDPIKPLATKSAEDVVVSSDPETIIQDEVKPVRGLAPLPGAENPDDIDAFILSMNDQQALDVANQQYKELMGPEPVPEGAKANALKKSSVQKPGSVQDGPFVTGGKIASEMLYKAPVKGIRDAVEETIDLGLELGNTLNDLTKGGALDFMSRPVLYYDKEKGLQFMPDVSGNINPDDVNLPDPTGEMETTVGGIEKSIVQFVTGFIGAGKVLKPLKALSKAPLTAAYIKGFASTFAAFDGHQERLSNLVQSVDEKWRPGVIDTVTKYLQAEEDDPELLGRLKGAVEDAGLGLALEPIVQGIRALRAATKIKKVTKATTFEEAAKQVQTDYDAVLKAENQPVNQVDNLLGPTEGSFIHKPNEIPKDLNAPPAVDANGNLLPENVSSMSAEVPAGLSPTQYGDQTIHVNFNKIDTPEELTQAINEMKINKPAPKTEPDGRPIAPQPVTFKDAKVAGTEATWDLMINSRNKRIKNGQSTPLVAEDQEALKALYVSASNKLDEVIKAARAAPTSENLFAFRKMLSTFGIINNELMGIRHETNRAINIWRKSDQVPMRRMRDIEETLERTGGIEDNKKLLDQLAIHLDSDAKAGIALAKMAQASRRYGTVRAIRNFWTLGLLTNWKTHEVNAISNTIMMFQIAAERAGAAKYTQALNIQGGVAPGEASAMLSGMWSSLGDAMRNAGRTFRSGEGGGAFNKIETPFEHNAFEDSDTALKKFVNTSLWHWGAIGRALQASDEFFKTLNFAAATNAEIQRKVYWEIQSGKLAQDQMAARITALKNDIPEEILLKAEDMARYATFTREPGRITKAASRFINTIPAGRYIVPFINTPSNLFNASIERTPFAVLQKTFKDAVRRGGADESLAITKMTMGSTFMAMSMSKAFDGEVTGSGPPYWSKDYARWRAEGKQPYAIKKGDKWIAYNRFDPMGMVLGLGADMAERLQSIDESDASSLADWQNLFAGTIFSIASQVSSKTYMQGAANLFEALNNPDVNANSFVQMFAGGLIPAGVGEVARQVDPVQRQSYDYVTKWKSRIPGLSSTLEPKLDQWGREQKFGTGNPVIDAINPVNITQENISPIDHEFDLQGYSIPKEIVKFTVDGAVINLKTRPDVCNFAI